MKKFLPTLTAILLFASTAFALSPKGEDYDLRAPSSVVLRAQLLTWVDDASVGASGYKIECQGRDSKWRRIFRGTAPAQRSFSVASTIQYRYRVYAYRENQGNGPIALSQEIIWGEEPTPTPTETATPDPDATPEPTVVPRSDITFTPVLEFVEPDGVYYDKGVGHLNIKVTAGIKTLPSMFCKWTMTDEFGAFIQGGEETIPLQETISYTPFDFSIPSNGSLPRYGWFNIKADFYVDEEEESPFYSRSKHIAVTPMWRQLPGPAQSLESGESEGSTNDVSRAGFAGQVLRLNCDGSAASIAKTRADALQAVQYGVPVFLQITNRSDVMDADGTPNTTYLKAVARGLGDVISGFEIINEPTTGASPLNIASYITYLRAAHNVIKSVNPKIKIMGPTLVNLNLRQIEKFLALGGGDLIDEFTFHDYEGNNAINAEMYETKWDEVNALLEKYGMADKPKWQTEHGSLLLFGKIAYPYLQMCRIALQRDLSARSGVPLNRNSLFYLNSHGYDSFPSWMWDKDGAYPAALLCRTQKALIGDKQFFEQSDFGTSGNALFHGVGYEDATGVVYSLMDMGVVWPTSNASSQQGLRCGKILDFRLTGASSAKIYDVYGNLQTVSASGGVLSLSLTQAPQLVVLPAGARLQAPKLDWGTNKMAGAQFTWSGPLSFQWNGETKGSDPKYRNFSLLTDGELVKSSGGLFLGNFPTHESNTPGGTLIDFGETLTAKFEAKTLSRLVFYGTEPDNVRSQFQDYDLEIQNADGSFETVAEVRSPNAGTLISTMEKARGIAYADISKTHVLEFAPRSAIGFRLKVLKTSYGLEADIVAEQFRESKFGSGQPAYATLYEIGAF